MNTSLIICENCCRFISLVFIASTFVKNELEPLLDADGLAELHPIFCGSEICGEVIIKDWDLGLCAPYYFGTILVENCNISRGDNHAGYMGFRDPNNTNQLEDDGAINVVVENWKN